MFAILSILFLLNYYVITSMYICMYIYIMNIVCMYMNVWFMFIDESLYFLFLLT